MIIPPEQLSSDVLTNLIEEFITREGTDYGWHEMSLADKTSQLRQQIAQSEVLIVFDAPSESVNLMTSDQYRQLPND